jgi:pimeloyl-ACP methyl ester carboxylesterase
MINIKNEIFVGSNNRKSLIDITIPDNFNNKICFFVHGYKGYKDWGAWSKVELEFVKAGFAFVKFNLSHNGGTIENPIDFPDLEAFSENTYSKEIYDIECVLKDFEANFPYQWKGAKKYLIGHSRGGGDVVLTFNRNQERLDGLITWAAISDIKERFPKEDELAEWRESGVRYVMNGRTKQNMPHKFSFYQDFIDNQKDLDIEAAAKSITKPWLIVHGENDEAVLVDDANKLKGWSGSELNIIPETGHTFGTKHPFDEEELPLAMQEVVSLSLAFLNRN